ncbi:MAG: glutamate synthase central domain-containing protein [Bacteroidia bacterium]
MLDRNGLRPCRHTITFDNRLIISSETGALPVDQKIIREKGRLEPGKMILADLEKGEIRYNVEIKEEVARTRPYDDWIKKHRIALRSFPDLSDPFFISPEQAGKLKAAHGYTIEDIDKIVIPMALTGKEPIGSMGLEIPLAGLSRFPQHPANYLKQFFAQVSNSYRPNPGAAGHVVVYARWEREGIS